MHLTHKLKFTSIGLLLLASQASQAKTWTGTTSAAWNTDTNWLEGAQPASGEGIVFDTNSTANLATTLGAGFSVSGITVTSPTGAVTIANGTGGSLTVGSGGIDLSAATQNLTFNSVVTVGAAQSWNVATGRTLTFTLGSNTTFGAGGFTLTKSGAGSLLLTGANFSNGTLQLTGGTTTMQGFSSIASGVASGATLQIDSGATFDVIRSSGNFTLGGSLKLNGGTWRLAPGTTNASTLNGTLEVSPAGGTFTLANNSGGGFTQTINSTLTGSGLFSVKNQSTLAASVLIFAGNASAFTGTFDVSGASGTRAARLNTAVAGSSSATFNVATGNRLEVNGVAVDLGNLTGPGVVRGITGTSTLKIGALGTDATFSGVIDNTNPVNIEKTGVGKLTLSGLNTYTGSTTVSQGTLSLSAATLADTSRLDLTTGATLDLTHSATDTIDKLYIDGVQQFAGTWGSPTSGAAHTTPLITGSGRLSVTTGPPGYASWAAGKGLAAGVNDSFDQDPDGDGRNNLAEFAFDGEPLSGKSTGKLVGKPATLAIAMVPQTVQTITLPVRGTPNFSGSPHPTSDLVDGVVYQIEASVDLTDWNTIPVEEVPAADATVFQTSLNLPALSTGWTYRTFYVPGSDPASNIKVFLRAKVSGTP